MEQTKFDYTNLIGDEFARYQKHIDSLAPTDAPSLPVLFEEYRAQPVFGSQQSVVGIKLLDEQPIRVVSTEVRYARLHNQQIGNAQSRAHGGTFYLIKQNDKS